MSTTNPWKTGTTTGAPPGNQHTQPGNYTMVFQSTTGNRSVRFPLDGGLNADNYVLMHKFVGETDEHYQLRRDKRLMACKRKGHNFKPLAEESEHSYPHYISIKECTMCGGLIEKVWAE